MTHDLLTDFVSVPVPCTTMFESSAIDIALSRGLWPLDLPHSTPTFRYKWPTFLEYFRQEKGERKNGSQKLADKRFRTCFACSAIHRVSNISLVPRDFHEFKTNRYDFLEEQNRDRWRGLTGRIIYLSIYRPSASSVPHVGIVVF